MLDADIFVSGGLLLIAFIVFAESGLLFGFFFPGDTLLIAAGLLASQGKFELLTLLPTIAVSATLGGIAGYYIGEKAGPKLFKKEDGIVFRKAYVARAEEFYEKHGGKTIMLARFIPIIRTFAPVVAGIGHMNKFAFNAYNFFGSIVWGVGVTLLGYFFGSKIPNLDHFILPIIVLVMVASFGPTAYHIISNPLSRRKLKQLFFRR
jgi:membrane-associated protein